MQVLSLPRLSVLRAGCRGPLPTCFGRGCAGVGAQHCPLGLHALWGAACRGVGGGPSTGVVALHCCEGRLLSGAVPPLAARPFGRAAGLPRTVCSGCGWCGYGDPAPVPQPALLRAVGAHCAGGGRESPGGGCAVRLLGASESRRSPSPSCRPLEGCRGPLPTCCGGVCERVWGPSTVPSACMPCGGLPAAGALGGRPRGGWPSIIVRAVWCQALSLPWPPVFWGRQPGTATRVSRVQLVWAWGPSTGPTACVFRSRRCALWGWRKGIPRGGDFRRCEGRLSSRAPPPPAARPLGGLSGSATHVLWARVCRCGGPALSPWPACPVGGCVPRHWWGAVPGGGGLPLLWGASGVRRCSSPGRPSFGAGSRGSATRVTWVWLVWVWRPSSGPAAGALAGRCCALWGWWEGVPGGGCLARP